MNLLVSDYDDTLYTNNYSIYLNIEAIKKFRNNGNLFVISTARNFDSIKKEIKKYNIPYDYLNCINGSLLFDNKDNLLKIDYINKDNANNIFRLLEKNDLNTHKITYYDEKNTTNNLDNCVELGISVNDIRNIYKYYKILSHFKDDMSFEFFYNKFFIKNKKNKSDGIKDLQELIDIDSKDIYTIGDNINDLEMLQQYNGYNMWFSHPKLYGKTNGICLSVKHLIKKIEKK